MNFGKKILNYKEEILSDLAKIIEIPSVASRGRQEVERALEFVLSRGKEFGLTTENFDNLAGHIKLGNSGKTCGIATHLDVVDGGENWSYDPFTLTRANDRLYGRGVADDKGAAIITLYCLRALKDEGIVGKNTICAIFGTDEETGMTDLEHYFSNQPYPDLSFTPDSNYGICKSEKGILQAEISTDIYDGTVITEFVAGKAVNAVPDIAYALINCSEEEERRLEKLSKQTAGDFTFKNTIDGLVIISNGKAAHACEPEKGFNSATALIDLLFGQFSTNELGSVFEFINKKVGTETNGVSLGIKMRDASSGALTLNIGKVNVTNGKASATIDIRYPASVNGQVILTQLEKGAKQKNVNLKILNHILPLNVDTNSDIIKILSSAYTAITNQEPKLYSTGGGTYARKMGSNSVGFGPVFDNDDSRMHNSDEGLNEDNFWLHAQICLQAIYELSTAEI